MAYTAPRTWVAGELVTAALGNTHWRDNLLETAPAKATAEGGIFVATAANAIAERIPQTTFSSTNRTTASTSFVELTGALTVTVTTGTLALVMINAHLFNATVGSTQRLSYAVSGATTIAANDSWALTSTMAAANAGLQATMHDFPTLTAGSNVFTLNARTTGGTMTADNQRLTVIPLS